MMSPRQLVNEFYETATERCKAQVDFIRYLADDHDDAQPFMINAIDGVYEHMSSNEFEAEMRGTFAYLLSYTN